jgi:DtxR family transcriptional regulator, Mn-dependent transcriptional regulator
MTTKTKEHAHEDHLSHSMVHYLLTIHKLKENRGFARVTDIAKDLDLTKGSVSTMLNNLKKKGLIQEEDECKFVVLTDSGHDEVHRILSSRTLIYYFLKDFVGVDAETAEYDSCQMEHLMSPKTSEHFFNFMKKLACAGDDLEKTGVLPKSFQFKTTLDLCSFASSEEFIHNQKGDSHLQRDK